MPVSDIAGKTLGQVLFDSVKAGAVDWLEIEGNHERLAPAVVVGIEHLVTSWEESSAAAAELEVPVAPAEITEPPA